DATGCITTHTFVDVGESKFQDPPNFPTGELATDAVALIQEINACTGESRTWLGYGDHPVSWSYDRQLTLSTLTTTMTACDVASPDQCRSLTLNLDWVGYDDLIHIN